MKGNQVAQGTANVTDTVITVATNGVWASGGNVDVGHYQFYTDSSGPGIAGGGVDQWNRAAAPPGYDVEVWYGEVTTGGASSLYVTTSEIMTGYAAAYALKSSDSNATWSLAAAASQDNAASTTVAYPSLSGNAGDAYFGAAIAFSTTSNGSTPGFTYASSFSNYGGVTRCYDMNLPSGAVAPTSLQASSAVSYTTGARFSASAGTISFDNSWLQATAPMGTRSITVSVAPSVGDLMVVLMVQNAGGGGGGIPTGGSPLGCLFQVCPATNMFNPVDQSYGFGTAKDYAMPAWIGVAQGRYYYLDTVAAATIASTYAVDPCFNGSWLDTARPHIPWISSSTQGSIPNWSTTVSNMVAAGLSGWTYELPSNEPEFGGYNQAAIISTFTSARAAVLAADPTAKCLAYCSAGVPESSTYAEQAAVLAAVTYDAASRHSENSVTNLPDLYVMRQDMTQIAANIAASTNPTATLWDTETGMYGAYYGTYHPRRHASQVTKFLMARESFGWRKELCYTYDTFLGSGGNPPSGYVEGGSGVGNVRMGAYAAHIMSEALYGTTCSPTAKPAQLSFGTAGSIGDVFFFGLHYNSSLGRDVIVLATNGIGYTAGETVTLDISSRTGMLVWDGEGHDITSQCTISGTHVTVPVDDLLTYVFLPTGVTVSVVDTGSRVISALNSATNVITTAPSLVNESSTAISGLAWGNSPGAAYRLPGAAPYKDTTIPAKATASGWPSASDVAGYAIKSVFPWNNGPTSSSTPTAFALKINGSAAASVTNSSAVSVAVVGSPSADTIVRTTYWDHAFAWLGTFSSQSATTIELDITAASYGGETDAACVPSFWVPYSVPSFQLADFAILSFSEISPTSSGSDALVGVKRVRLAAG